MVAGSNPHADVTTNTVYPTTWTAEYFYPSYFSASVRPVPQGIPTSLSYGGDHFDITIPSSSYTGSVDTAAAGTTAWLIRQGFTTHAMNMGQRSMQLNTTYTIKNDGTIILHTAQLPPNPNLFQPGPAFLFVTIAGIPSNGTYVIVGNGQYGTQPTAQRSVLPASGHEGSATSTSGASSSSSTANVKGKNSATSSYTASGSIFSLLSAVAMMLVLS